MKLYGFQPKGHGELSFFVIAKSKEKAIEYINKKIEKMKLARAQKDWDSPHFYDGFSNYEINGWGTDYYEITEANTGDVLINNNS